MQSEEAQAQAFVLVIPEPKIQKKHIVHFLVSLSLIKTKVSEEKYKTFPNLPLG